MKNCFSQRPLRSQWAASNSSVWIHRYHFKTWCRIWPSFSRFQEKQYMLYCHTIDCHVLGMTLKYIWWWGSNSGNLKSEEYPFIVISPPPTLIRNVRDPSISQIDLLKQWVRIIIIIILLFWEFFTPTLADGFSLEFEWQQVSSSLQDSSQ